jgi:hypothetical protein
MADAAKKIDAKGQVDEEQTVAADVKPVGINRFALAEQHRNHFHVNCKIECEPDNVLDSTFWEHVAAQLSRGDIVTVIPDNLAWEMSVVVLDRGHNWALVRERYRYDFGEVFDPMTGKNSDYEIEWAGTTEKYRVKHKGRVLRGGFATEALANRYAANHAGALKR